MMGRFARIFSGAFLAAALASVGGVRMADAHPHVFVKGGVSFVLDDQQALTALKVIWRYDLFETLYALSSLEIVPDAGGKLAPEDRQRVSEHMTDWPEAFNGSAHLSIADEKIAMLRPTSMDVELVDGSLVMRFQRDLEAPISMTDQTAEVGFYEETYFYAFSVTEEPEVHGANTGQSCSAEVIPFDPNAELEALQVTLFALGREETPDAPDVGALFADRIVLKCE
ncbi:MAG: DUF1007 family protein [Pseudomonadota bacterium]